MAESIAEPKAAPSYEETPFLSTKGHDQEPSIKNIGASNETLLWDLRLQRDAETSRQLEILEAIREELASQSTPLQFAWNAVLQVIFVAVGILFGIFAIYGWHTSLRGNVQSLQQNQMNLVFFCLTSNSNITATLCGKVIQEAPATLAYMAALSFPGSSLDANISWPWPVQAEPTYQLNTPEALITWFAVPVTTVLIGLFAARRLYREKFGDGKARMREVSKSKRDAGC